MSEETKQDRSSGLLVKHKPAFVRWLSAGLREAGLDAEGYYLKVDGIDETTRETEQLYLYIPAQDVAQVIGSWMKEIKAHGSKWAKFLLESEMH